MAGLMGPMLMTRLAKTLVRYMTREVMIDYSLDEGAAFYTAAALT